MHSIQNLLDSVKTRVQELESVSTRLKTQTEDFSAICLALIPDDLDSETAYNFCVIYTLLTKLGFSFAGYCPSSTDLQWILFKNETDHNHPCVGKLYFRYGQWKTDSLVGGFTALCPFDDLLKSADIAFL